MPRYTDNEAAALLKSLSEHYREPVMPINQYCKALLAWQDQIGTRSWETRCKLFPGVLSEDLELRKKANDDYGAMRQRYLTNQTIAYRYSDLFRDEALEERIRNVFLQIAKSNLLWRLLYRGEKLRTRKCPEHKGRWSGCFGKCEHGCGLTGWLPEPEDAG